jgi:SPOR domain
VAEQIVVAESQTAALQGPAITEAATAVSEPAATPAADAAIADFLAEAWDAPEGTILVQVSAVEEKGKVIDEWHRLQNTYPQVLRPLRLVVEEAKLGERGVFFRVQGGAFGSEAGATEACESLISLGQACFVVVR